MVINAMIKELEALDHEVKVLFPDMPDGAEDAKPYYEDTKHFEIWRFPIEEDGVKLDTFPLMISDPHPRNPNTYVLKNLNDAQFRLYFETFKEKVEEVIEAYQPDIIECHHIWMMNQVISSLGYNVIATAHHSDQIGFRQDKRMQPYAFEGAQKAAGIFAVSDQVNQEVRTLYGAPSDKVHTVTNGFDDTIYVPKELDRASVLESLGLDIPDDEPIVTFVGKISKTKGFDILLEANRRLVGKNIHFLIFGAGDVSHVIHAGNHRYSQDNIHYLGHRDAETISEAHAIAKAAVFPSRTEGFPIAPLEAMGCGLPVIVTRCGAPEDFAVGEVVNVEDSKALAEAISKLVALDEDEAKLLSDEAVEKSKDFCWKKIAERRVKLYEKFKNEYE